MNWKETIYAHSPIWAQNLMVSAYGWQWKRRRFGGIFAQEVAEFKRRESFDAQQWRDYQTVRLRELLIHAFETTLFYRKKYAACGLTAASLARFELEDLPRLPFLEKDELRRYGTGELLSTRLEPGGAFFGSSGSTGAPVQIRYSHAFHQRVNAAMEARVRAWAGVDGHTPRGMIGGRRVLPRAHESAPFYRYNFFEKQTYFSAYHISTANAADYVRGMRSGKTAYMTGYAMSNYLLAQAIGRAGLRAPELKAVITSSEKLTPEMRDTFRRIYGCRTFDTYSGVENCALIAETPSGQLAIQPDVGIVEILDPAGRPVAPGETGELVCTGLLNQDQPLIRYRCGDLARRGLAASPDVDMPTVEAIDGRTEDLIETRDGRLMVRFHSIFIGMTPVVEGQIIQYSPERYAIRVTLGAPLDDESRRQMASRLKSQVGDDCKVDFEVVDAIPRGPNGKFKAVISAWNRR
ncbi:MAG: phenylacetate--CoA ligase family protein [Saprospiraceae bacterium]